MAYQGVEHAPLLPGSLKDRLSGWLNRLFGYGVLAITIAGAVSLLTWSAGDPSLTRVTSGPVYNWLGPLGAIFSDLITQMLGIAGVFFLLPPVFWALQLVTVERLDRWRAKLVLAPVAVLLLAAASSSLPRLKGWPLTYDLGGCLGDQGLRLLAGVFAIINPERAVAAAGLFCFASGVLMLMASLGISRQDLRLIFQRSSRESLRGLVRTLARGILAWWREAGIVTQVYTRDRLEPKLGMPSSSDDELPAEVIVRPRPRPDEKKRPAPPSPSDESDATHDEGARRIAEIFAPRRGDAVLSPQDDAEPAPPAVPRAAAPRPSAPVAAPTPRPSPSPGPRSPFGFGALPPAEKRVQRDAGRDRHTAAPTKRARSAPKSPFGLPTMPPEPPYEQPASASDDEYYDRAVDIVLSERRASRGYLQRRLGIGYMLAADLIERMERDRVIGPPAYNGHRLILATDPRVSSAPW